VQMIILTGSLSVLPRLAFSIKVLADLIS